MKRVKNIFKKQKFCEGRGGERRDGRRKRGKAGRGGRRQGAGDGKNAASTQHHDNTCAFMCIQTQ